MLQTYTILKLMIIKQLIESNHTLRVKYYLINYVNMHSLVFYLSVPTLQRHTHAQMECIYVDSNLYLHRVYQFKELLFRKVTRM